MTDVFTERQQDHFHDECGVIAVMNHSHASERTYLGLYALQHRGQEGAGIAARNESGRIAVHRKLGLVADVFEKKHFAKIPGAYAIGHVRYSTQGGNVMENLQPILVDCKFGQIAVAHNGNLPSARKLRVQLESEGAIFQTTSDTELIVHLMSRSKRDTLVEALTDALKIVEGAFSLVILTKDSVIAARDPYGFRPLLLGRNGSEIVIASETCAFDLMGVKYERDIAPGEIAVFSKEGERSLHPLEKKESRFCIFEMIYFSRPDSSFGGRSVHETRVALGEQLAKESPAPGAQIVVPVPDSGVGAAIGFARVSGIPFDMAIIRNHYVHRTFIKPQQEERQSSVRIKLNPVENLVRGKSIVVVDDSVVRGTTSRKLVQLFRDAGAREVHLRISSPPVIGPCHFGIDTPRREELIASHQSVEQIRKFVGADTLGYLSVKGMHAAVAQGRPASGRMYCDACFTDDYPMRSALDA